jgi:hypothetical protein
MKKWIFLFALGFLGYTYSIAQVIDPNININRPSCPNPAVTDLQIQTQNLADGYVKVTVKATVKNIGGKAYSSNPGQQALFLYKNGTYVAKKDFEDLAVGISFSMTYSYTAKRTVVAQTVSFKAQINYDPDIRMDGNTGNDDCKSADNSKEKSITI